MASSSHIACHECDLIHTLGDIPPGGAARCHRCGCLLYRPRHDSLNRSLALAIAGVILFIIANTHPFLGFKMGSQVRETLLASGIYELYFQDMALIATLVLLTVILVPAINLICLLYMLVPLKMGKVPRHLARVLRFYVQLKPWGMLEIFMLGIMVAGFKLAKMAEMIPGVALFSFMGLIFVLATILVVFDEHQLWERVEY
ncbi:MAG: paraquat-inducible protein A [Desulfobulbaceae bacterium]|nr:MAG: paraquat-inducible protein A [Desulfobulbaceae bacterium]